MENKKMEKNTNAQKGLQPPTSKDIGNWDILTNDKSGELGDYNELWTGLKKQGEEIALENQLKNASKETLLCVNMINAQYDDDVNIVVPDAPKEEEELALTKAINYLKESQYRGIWSKEEAHDIYLTLQKLPIPIVSKTNLSVLLYNTFHPPDKNNLEPIEDMEDDEQCDTDDDDDDDDINNNPSLA